MEDIKRSDKDLMMHQRREDAGRGPNRGGPFVNSGRFQQIPRDSTKKKGDPISTRFRDQQSIHPTEHKSTQRKQKQEKTFQTLKDGRRVSI